MGVRRLAPAGESAARSPVEGDAAGEELGDPGRAVRHERVDRGRIAQTPSGADRVGGMGVRTVAGPVAAGYAALRERRASAPEAALRHDGHRVPGLVSVQCGGEPGDTGADDDDVHRAPAATGGLAASIRSSARRAGSATPGETVMRFGVRPATSSSRTHAR